MPERTPKPNRAIRDFVSEVAAIDKVIMIAQINTADGPPMICTIVSGYPEMDEVVRDWAPIAGKHYGHLGSARVSVGPVLSAGQFQEYIKGSGELRTSRVLYDSSVV